MKIIKFYSDCVVTLGMNRAIISDLVRQKFVLIPRTMGEFINQLDGKEESELLIEFSDQRDILLEYLGFLTENEFIFWCSSVKEAKCFSQLNTQWDYFGQISNAIIEIQTLDKNHLGCLLLALQKLGCQSLKVVIYNTLMQEEILSLILNLIEGSTITSTEVNLVFKQGIELRLLQMMKQFPRLLKGTVFLSPKNEVSEKVKQSLWKHSKVFFTTDELTTRGCGQVHWAYFTSNITHYTESLAHNTCLNRKIAIDVEGNIKNCPSMKESFGNIKDTTLEEALNKPGFKKYWNITKDDITKCKDCEFRHVCTDCRAYIENPEDMYSAPLKCGYDPYTCEWEEWSTNPLKQQAIEHYGMQELVKKA